MLMSLFTRFFSKLAYLLMLTTLSIRNVDLMSTALSSVHPIDTMDRAAAIKRKSATLARHNKPWPLVELLNLSLRLYTSEQWQQ